MKPATPAEVDEIEALCREWRKALDNRHNTLPLTSWDWTTEQVESLVARIRQLERIVAGSH